MEQQDAVISVDTIEEFQEYVDLHGTEGVDKIIVAGQEHIVRSSAMEVAHAKLAELKEADRGLFSRMSEMVEHMKRALEHASLVTAVQSIAKPQHNGRHRRSFFTKSMDDAKRRPPLESNNTNPYSRECKRRRRQIAQGLLQIA